MSSKVYSQDDIARMAGLISDNIVSQFKTGMEAIDEILVQTRKIPKMEETLEKLSSDMDIVKLALKHTNQDVQNHERRITKLEQKAAA
jgi:hypothetical protein